MSSLSKSASTSCSSDDDGGLRRGPWTVEEDTLLIHYISSHGEGRWNLLAKRSGLKRTGKSCRLRWLNYLKPDVKRGNLSPEEQLLILELHSKWGNRWSKIAQHLPGRTDNEIKNYWRTRVQKQARHLKIDPNSTQFQELVRCVWMPRLLQKIQGQSTTTFWDSSNQNPAGTNQILCNSSLAAAAGQTVVPYAPVYINEGETSNDMNNQQMYSTTMDNSSSRSPSMSSSSASESTNISKAHRISDQIPYQDMMDSHYCSQSQSESYNVDNTTCYDMETFSSTGAFTVVGGSKDPTADLYSGYQNNWLADELLLYGLWNMDELSQLRER